MENPFEEKIEGLEIYRWITVDDCSEKLEVSRRTVFQYIKNGFFKRVSGDGIIQLYYGKRLWSIYLDRSLLFIREKKSNFRRILDSIVNGNFTVTKMETPQEDI